MRETSYLRPVGLSSSAGAVPQPQRQRDLFRRCSRARQVYPCVSQNGMVDAWRPPARPSTIGVHHAHVTRSSCCARRQAPIWHLVRLQRGMGKLRRPRSAMWPASPMQPCRKQTCQQPPIQDSVAPTIPSAEAGPRVTHSADSLAVGRNIDAKRKTQSSWCAGWGSWRVRTAGMEQRSMAAAPSEAWSHARRAASGRAACVTRWHRLATC
jgi:hypothetical protein